MDERRRAANEGNGESKIGCKKDCEDAETDTRRYIRQGNEAWRVVVDASINLHYNWAGGALRPCRQPHHLSQPRASLSGRTSNTRWRPDYNKVLANVAADCLAPPNVS